MKRAAGRLRPLVGSTLARFMGVGVVNTAIDLSLYAVLHLAGVPIVLANLCSTTAGLTFSFLANRSFTFRATGDGRLRQLLLFLLTTGTGLWVLQPVAILVLTDRLAAAHALPAVLVLVPKVVGIVAGMVWNYCWYSRLVFRRASLAEGPTARSVLGPATSSNT